MNTLPLLRFEAIVGLLLLSAPSASWAQERFNVKALRTERVDLFDCGEEKRKTGQELTRAGFSGPLSATTVPGSSVYLQVQVNGQPYCVRAFAVETDRAVVVPDSECGTRVAGRQVNTGSNRGVGERCPR